MKVTEDTVGILGPVLVVEPLGDAVPECYPQVRLGIGEGESEHQVGVVWLENPYLKVAVCPGLGGRIVAIEDLRTGTHIIELPAKLPVVSGGFRGVLGEFGVEFLAGKARGNALGHVEYRVKDSAGPDDAVAVFLHEWVGDVSWHGVVTLPADRAAIILEQKVQNRSWRSQELRSGFRFAEMSDKGFWVNMRETGGLQLLDEDGLLDFRQDGDFATMPENGRLGGRRVDQWKVELIPFSGLGDHRCSGQAVSVGQVGKNLKVQAHKELKNCKIFLHVDGQTLEAPLDLECGDSSSTDLGDYAGRVDGIVVRSDQREVLASWPTAEAINKKSVASFPHEIFDRLVDQHTLPGAHIRRTPGMEAYGWEKVAIEFVRMGEWDKADEEMEKYLAYHAEDGLGWWFKASLMRESGRERQDEDRELPNAHYLIPLEPVLKAEAFLNTPQAQGAEANTLLASVAADPGVAAGVVAMYYEKGLWKGMARLADELLRHRQNAIIHYLVGAALLKNQTMESTAAEHLSMAERLPIEPPFPYRMVELEAIAILFERFPTSERLQKVGEIVEAAKRAGRIDH